jgi:YebC/PmpR family DNA-binding regulatory protein
MAGHSKWANIKHRKMRADAKKGKEFTKVTKEIITAVKHGGADPKTNVKLKIAIQKAKAVNLPQENIDRNIKKASSADQADYFEMMYELYGHGGVGILVEVMTDNKNRIASDMRIATNKRGGTIASPGAVSYNFAKKGIIQVPKAEAKEEDLFLLATELGAEDFEVEEEFYMITTPPELFIQVKEGLDEKGIKTEECSLQMIPSTFIECEGEARDANIALIDWLEDLDDVNEIYHNMA